VLLIPSTVIPTHQGQVARAARNTKIQAGDAFLPTRR